jgi:acyl dehydratase
MPTVFESPAELQKAVGQTLGESAWLEVTQERVNLFADATDDHQWIHVDPARAKQGPFGAPIAHGYLTLSLVSRFLPEIVVVKGIAKGVNYGVDKVRFPSPVRVGSRIRGRGELVEAEAQKDGSVQAKIRVTVEVEGQPKPACVAETLSRFYPAR